MIIVSQWLARMEIIPTLMTTMNVLPLSLSTTLPPPPTLQAHTPPLSNTPHLMIHPHQGHTHLPLPPPLPIGHTHLHHPEHPFMVDTLTAARTLQLCRDIRND